MQDTAGTWLMTSLTASPLLIALMQTAASLPVLLLGLLAGATADIFDRRKLLIFWQAWMLASVGVLAVLTFVGYLSPWALLAFTFLLNVGSAMNNPAWQAIVPELVPRELIPDTVSLNAASNNLARAVGPALGGLMVAGFQRTYTGAGSVFALNALSFAGVIWVLVNWKRIPLFKSALPSERDCGVDPLGAAICAVCAGSAVVAGSCVHVYVFYLGDLVAAGGGGEARSEAGTAGVWHSEWLARAGGGDRGYDASSYSADGSLRIRFLRRRRFITWSCCWCWRLCAVRRSSLRRWSSRVRRGPVRCRRSMSRCSSRCRRGCRRARWART